MVETNSLMGKWVQRVLTGCSQKKECRQSVNVESRLMVRLAWLMQVKSMRYHVLLIRLCKFRVITYITDVLLTYKSTYAW